MFPYLWKIVLENIFYVCFAKLQQFLGWKTENNDLLVFFEGNFQKNLGVGGEKIHLFHPYFPNKWIKGGKTPESQFPPLIEGHELYG